MKARKHFSDELDATEQYLEDLQLACVDGDSTYEDRKQACTDEIYALHKAHGILAEALKEKLEEGDEGKIVECLRIRVRQTPFCLTLVRLELLSPNLIVGERRNRGCHE